MSIAEEIKSRCNIVDVISRTIDLKRTGVNYKGLCPFHNEKTPSFIVSDEKQYFTCYGCGASGDVIEFIKKYYNLDFMEAVKRLASEYNIDISEFMYDKESDKAELYEINRLAALFFYNSIKKDDNPALKYLNARGIIAQAVKKFGIGYADKEWDSLKTFFEESNVDQEKAIKLGLLSKSKGKVFDKFRNRIIFPIINTSGKVVGFGGRAISDELPKYLNSNESVIFKKKNNLFGLNLAKRDINNNEFVILVEGYMDVISLFMYGIKNVVATLGTALTKEQAIMLRRYSENVVLAYDMDDAGIKAAMRGADILYETGCNVKVVSLRDKKDPDDYVKTYGKESFLKLIDQAKPSVKYKLDLIKKENDMKSTEGRLAFLKGAVLILKTLSPIEAEEYIKWLAKESGISEGAIRSEVFDKKIKAPVSEIKYKPDYFPALERNLLSLMLFDSKYIDLIKEFETVFETENGIKIFHVICNNRNNDLNSIKENLTEQENNVLSSILKTPLTVETAKNVYEDCVTFIETVEKQKREAEIIEELSVLDDEKDKEMIMKLSEELIYLQKEKLKERNR